MTNEPAPNAELESMFQLDQADRRLQLGESADAEAALAAIQANDAARRARVRELLASDSVVTGMDFRYAAVIFQHGEIPDDYLMAHDLAFTAMLKNPEPPMGLAGLTEDRFLRSLGRLQRFGSQGSYDPNDPVARIQPTEEDSETAVTDTLRADYMVPPLAVAKEKGVFVTSEYYEGNVRRARERRDPDWQTQAAASPESRELDALYKECVAAANPEAAAVAATARVLSIYRADALGAAAGYGQAAWLLLRSAAHMAADAAEGRYLLAHELAVVAAIRGDVSARRTAAESWDRFLMRAGLAPRYGAALGALPSPDVSAAVRSELMASPHAGTTS
jgi:hypothetical protein